MKKYSTLVTIILIASLLTISGQAFAGSANNLNVGHQLNASETACPSGKKVLDVSYKLENSLDSGTGDNDYDTVWWAMIDYILQVKVVEIGENEYCATVKNQGSFESVGGDGPGCVNDNNCGSPAGRLQPGVIGTFQGGYTMTFTSNNFNPESLRTRGSIGKFDHDCDPSSGNGACDGDGVTRWRTLFFPDYSGVSWNWWGWVYHAGNNGSWVNKIDGNEGNITGN